MDGEIDPGAVVAEALGRLLLRDTRAGLHRRLTEGIDGLDPTTYPVLSGIDRVGEVSSAELARSIGLDRTVTSRHASRLERAGLVTRRPHATDRRAAVLALTPEGWSALAVTRRRLRETVAAFLAGYPPGEVDRFEDMLDRLVRHLRAG